MADQAATTPPLRYLSSADLDDCLPPVVERLDLARRALTALATGDAEMPPKIGVHPRDGALLHAMPAWLRSADLVGLKWVSAFPGNKRLGVPAISGLVVLNDPETGLPTWVLDAARITAVRTAAVSGEAIRLLGPAGVARRVAMLGAGVQARSHAEVIEALLPAAEIALHDRHVERATALAGELNAARGEEWVRPSASVSAAVSEADVVVTVATLGAVASRLGPTDVRPGALVVAVDFATYVAPELARDARTFAVDDRAQFMHYREIGYFEGYPEPATTLGELAVDESEADAAGAGEGPILVTHLGVGLADVVFADAICQRAARSGAGVELVR